MTALPDEIEGAVAEGIELQTLKAPRPWILMIRTKSGESM